MHLVQIVSDSDNGEVSTVGWRKVLKQILAHSVLVSQPGKKSVSFQAILNGSFLTNNFVIASQDFLKTLHIPPSHNLLPASNHNVLEQAIIQRFKPYQLLWIFADLCVSLCVVLCLESSENKVFDLLRDLVIVPLFIIIVHNKGKKSRNL